MSTKFEQLLDYLVNENMEKANELFHEIVVEKSRSIYENLIAEEDEEEMDESMEDDEEMDESMEDDEEMSESEEDLEDSYSMEADDEEDGMSPHDASDDLGMDTMDLDGEEDGEMGDDEGGENSAIYDIGNAIEELEAAFEKLEQAHGAGHDDMDADSEFGDSDSEFGDEGGEEDEMEMMGSHAFENRRMTREYVEKVGNDWEKNSQKSQGQAIGANTGESFPAPKEGKSPISSGSGKPTSGANARNLAQGGTDGQSNTGTSPAKVNKGINPEKSEQFTGKDWEKNSKAGANAGKTAFKTKVPAHGLAGNTRNNGSEGTPVGSGTGDKAGQTSMSPSKPFLKKL
jgi:hypothetical protein